MTRVNPRCAALSAFALLLLLAAALVPAATVDAAAREPEPNTLVPKGVQRYAPSVFPDRIVASPLQDASTGFSVSWRTDASVQAPLLEITVANDSPDQWQGDVPPRQVRAATKPLAGSNGMSHHHHAVVDGLDPGELYAWRVQGGGTWSPWRQLRLPTAGEQRFQLLYFGDTQNKNASLTTRVVQQALRDAPRAHLAVFAGDLVSEAVDDDEWGEWFDATAAISPTMLLAPAPGNHEFFEEHEDTPRERRVLGEPWKAHFALPRNGAPGVEATSYWFDYQDLRVAVVDGTSVLDLGAGKAQATWLARVLGTNPHRWSLVLIHQPFYSPRGGRDNALLRKQLQPVIERYKVDLVLQGHDHAYGRRSGKAGATPVYVVSVAGAKQYRLSAQARHTMAPVAEDTQLFQVLDFAGDRLRYRALTATGRLYDAFELVDGGNGRKTLVESEAGRIPQRECTRKQTLKGREDRCWE